MLRFALGAIAGHRLRSALSALGVAIGVAAVVLLTSLGEGTRDFVASQFSQFGTTLVVVNPGKVETLGVPGVLGGTMHKLDLEDAEALRQVLGVSRVSPLVMGQARVEGGGRARSVFVFGVTHEAPAVWSSAVGQGSFLPALDPRRQGASVVLGPTAAHELFAAASPLGARVRIGGRSLLVVGVMAAKGQMVGLDLDDAAYVPVATAMDLFDRDELTEIDVLAMDGAAVPGVVEGLRRELTTRHRGAEDFTITTQAEMLATAGRVIGTVTFAVGAIAAVSLLVGAIGILTILWISVHERTREIGVLRALGVTPAAVNRLFLLEATLVAVLGGCGGLLGAGVVVALLGALVPALPFSPSPLAIVSALVMSLAVGLASGWLPARHAARLDPIEALRAE